MSATLTMQLVAVPNHISELTTDIPGLSSVCLLYRLPQLPQPSISTQRLNRHTNPLNWKGDVDGGCGGNDCLDCDITDIQRRIDL